MKRKRRCRYGDLSSVILNVMSPKKFQTSSLVAAQVDIPPEVLYRGMQARKDSLGFCGTLERMKTEAVRNVLKHYLASGVLEREKNENGIWQYRLSSKKKRQSIESSKQKD
jgi:hypothetical protein